MTPVSWKSLLLIADYWILIHIYIHLILSLTNILSNIQLQMDSSPNILPLKINDNLTAQLTQFTSWHDPQLSHLWNPKF